MYMKQILIIIIISNINIYLLLISYYTSENTYLNIYIILYLLYTNRKYLSGFVHNGKKPSKTQ